MSPSPNSPDAVKGSFGWGWFVLSLLTWVHLSNGTSSQPAATSFSDNRNTTRTRGAQRQKLTFSFTFERSRDDYLTKSQRQSSDCGCAGHQLLACLFVIFIGLARCAECTGFCYCGLLWTKVNCPWRPHGAYCGILRQNWEMHRQAYAHQQDARCTMNDACLWQALPLLFWRRRYRGAIHLAMKGAIKMKSQPLTRAYLSHFVGK